MPCRLLTTVLLIVFASGCATTYTVKVDSIAEAATSAASATYVLVSGMSDVKETDLYFREFAAQFRRALNKKGMIEVADRNAAAVEINLTYGTSSGRNEFYTYTRPIYHFSGGERISYKEVKTDSLGQKTETTGSVYVPMRAQVIGYSNELNSLTVYTHYAVLEALALAQGEASTHQMWKTTIRLTNTSNDLRHLMPYMVTAAAPYLAGNTGTALTITLKPDDPQVAAGSTDAAQNIKP